MKPPKTIAVAELPDRPAARQETALVPRRLPRTARAALGIASSRAALALADQAIVSGLRFAAALVVGRIAGPGEFGLYAIAVGPLLLLGCCQEALVTTPFAVFGSRLQRRAKAAFAGASLAIHGVFAAVAATALAVGALVMAGAVGANQAASICAALAVAAPGFLLWEFARRMSFAQLQMGRAVIIDSAVAMLQLAGFFALAALGQLTAISALLSMAGGYYVVGAIWLLRFRKVPLPSRLWPGYWRRNWRFGRWLLAGQIVEVIQGMIPQWLLGITAGAAAAGTFTAYLNLALLANPAILAVANLLTPAAAHALAGGGREALNRAIGRAALWMATPMLLFAGIVAVWGESLVMHFFGSHYSGNTAAIALLGVCPLVWSISAVLSCGLTALRCNEANFRAAAAGTLVIMAVLGAFAAHGAAAAAAGILSGSIAAMVVRAWAFYDRSGASRRRLALPKQEG